MIDIRCARRNPGLPSIQGRFLPVWRQDGREPEAGAREAPEGVRHQEAAPRGGGRINGSFLAADLIDELSVLVAPIADGAMGTPSLFDASEGKGPARHLKLVSSRSAPVTCSGFATS